MNAVGGILLGVLGDPDVFLYFEFIGIVIFYIGFVMSSRFVFRANPAPSASSVATPAIRSDS
jgi:hypothetical protein